MSHGDAVEEANLAAGDRAAREAAREVLRVPSRSAGIVLSKLDALFLPVL